MLSNKPVTLTLFLVYYAVVGGIIFDAARASVEKTDPSSKHMAEPPHIAMRNITEAKAAIQKTCLPEDDKSAYQRAVRKFQQSCQDAAWWLGEEIERLEARNKRLEAKFDECIDIAERLLAGERPEFLSE